MVFGVSLMVSSYVWAMSKSYDVMWFDVMWYTRIWGYEATKILYECMNRNDLNESVCNGMIYRKRYGTPPFPFIDREVGGFFLVTCVSRLWNLCSIFQCPWFLRSFSCIGPWTSRAGPERPHQVSETLDSYLYLGRYFDLLPCNVVAVQSMNECCFQKSFFPWVDTMTMQWSKHTCAVKRVLLQIVGSRETRRRGRVLHLCVIYNKL